MKRLVKSDDTNNYASPLGSEEVGTCWFTFVRCSVCVCAVSLRGAFYRAGGEKRDFEPMLG